jgi:DNA polymerase-1
VWLRGLIQPPPGCGVAYINWAQQEFGIAGGSIRRSYDGGRISLGRSVSRQAGRSGAAGSEQRRTERSVSSYKQCVLAVQYGMGTDALAQRIAQPRSGTAALAPCDQEKIGGIYCLPLHQIVYID